MQFARPHGKGIGKLIKKVKDWLQWAHDGMPGPDYIDREYIEGETPDEIGQISQMTDIPDKAQRHLSPDERKW